MWDEHLWEEYFVVSEGGHGECFLVDQGHLVRLGARIEHEQGLSGGVCHLLTNNH